ncbi:hypothetical protein WA556_003000 [Blastocystis sp. ATCC 50177/Nand II]
MQNFLFGKGDRDPLLEECEDLAKQLIEKHAIIQILLAFPKCSFEERKAFAQVFCTLLSRDHYKFASQYMISQEGEDILMCLVNGCGDPNLTATCGTMLRQCIAVRCIHQLLFSKPSLIEPLFTSYAFDSNFDVSSDALQSIHDLLTKNKQLVSVALNPKLPLYSQVFGWYRNLICSDQYIIMRIVIKMLAEFLLDKINFDIMLDFVSSAENLKLFMTLLCSKYPTIQFEAFNVFKIFVANPDKSDDVKTILCLNRHELLQFLPSFLSDKSGVIHCN